MSKLYNTTETAMAIGITPAAFAYRVKTGHYPAPTITKGGCGRKYYSEEQYKQITGDK